MSKRHYIYAAIIAITLGILFYAFGHIRVTAVFEELQPFNHILPVYFKGFKLGHTSKVYLAPDYKSTRVELKLRLKDIKLPENTTAIIRRHDDKDYIELIYPNSPHLANLRNNSVIEGEKGVNFEHFLQNQAHNGGLEEMKNNVNDTIKSAGDTFEALTMMIEVLTDILNDVRPQIRETVTNVNHASANLAEASYDVKKSIKQGYIDASLYNLKQTTQNLVTTTQNMSGVTDNVNKRSINLLNCAISNINVLIKNINEIVVGVGETLKKRFGGLRLFFGKINS